MRHVSVRTRSASEGTLNGRYVVHTHTSNHLLLYYNTKKTRKLAVQHFHTRLTLDTRLTLTSSPILVELIQLTHSSLNLKANINVEFLSSAVKSGPSGLSAAGWCVCLSVIDCYVVITMPVGWHQPLAVINNIIIQVRLGVKMPAR